MDKIEYTLKGTMEKDISKKTNAEYEYLNLKLTDTYSKRVFLDSAEKNLLVNYNNKQTNPFGK